MMIGIGSNVRVIAWGDEASERNGGVQVEIGTVGTVLPQYIDGVETPSPIWADGTMLVRGESGELFSVRPQYLEVAA